MIEFYGILSEKCLNQFSKKKNLKNSLFFMFFTLSAIMVTIVLSLLKIATVHYFCLLSILMVILNVILLIVPAHSAIFRSPIKITINNDIIICSIEHLAKQFKPKIRKIRHVKKIIVYKDWYLIIFKYDITDMIVCQKNLIRKGTLEEFEKMFKNKLIRK